MLNALTPALGLGAAGAGLGAERAQVARRDAGPGGDQPGARIRAGHGLRGPQVPAAAWCMWP